MNWLEKAFINSPLHRLELRKWTRLLLRLGGPVQGGSVLEIGCGRGMGVDILFGEFGAAFVEAFDYDPGQVRLARKRLTPRHGDRVKVYEGSATEIPSPEGRFDAVFSLGVLHHVPDNEAAMREVTRVLKPGGRFFFQEPLASVTRNPVFHLLFGDVPEAQFTWNELSEKLGRAALAVSEGSCVVGRIWVVGVARKAPAPSP